MFGVRGREVAVRMSFQHCGGRGEIRTREEVAPLEVFKTSALDQLCDPSEWDDYTLTKRGY